MKRMPSCTDRLVPPYIQAHIPRGRQRIRQLWNISIHFSRYWCLDCLSKLGPTIGGSSQSMSADRKQIGLCSVVGERSAVKIITALNIARLRMFGKYQIEHPSTMDRVSAVNAIYLFRDIWSFSGQLSQGGQICLGVRGGRPIDLTPIE